MRLAMPPDLDLAPLAALVAQVAPGAGPLAAEPMPGGASTRRYFRVALPGEAGANGTSAVGMFVPEGAKPEEIMKGHPSAASAPRWPFLEVRDLLAARGIHVPKILAEDCARGWILLEDLGDDTLANYLVKHPGEKVALYTRAVTDLARAQEALASLPAASVVAGRAFDEDLLRWEIDHFREWGLEARGVVLSDADRRAFDGVAERLARRVAALPRGFVHRDYQSRNLMVRDGALVWIDFQDALLGPHVYDLVALLNDSYQEFDRAFVDARLDEYARARRADRAALGREFDLVTVQRKLKDAGRFVFIDLEKGNPSFLRFVAPTVARVKGALARLAGDADMATLADLLARALPHE
jgi:aminoglycoside/choline kinase family phosphotransferase